MTDFLPATAVATSSSTLPALALVLPAKFPLALLPEQESRVRAQVSGFDIEAITPRQIVALAADSEQALNRVLDGFLSHVSKADAPKLFALVSRLNDGVAEERLPQVAQRILDPKPGFVTRMVGKVQPRVLRDATQAIFEEAARLATGKSKKLSELVAGLERELITHMKTLDDELVHLDTVKDSYRDAFVAFAADTVFLVNALAKARAAIVAMEPRFEKEPMLRVEMEDKLQALESRALAIEGTMSRLPADQLVIRQLQNAGVQTLQELSTTMSARFSSIKMTLLTLDGALKVQTVQRLGQQGADLDKNLAMVRGALMKDVVINAASAPGVNRLAQANQITAVVRETGELMTASSTAKAENTRKFEEARALMADAREQMLTLGREINPGARVTRTV